MKAPFVILLTLLVAGCTSTRPSAALTPDQAQTLARQLANEKASALYHCQPFQNGPPAQFASGHWVWTGLGGIGHSDLQATVELAANGSTNQVDLQFLYNQNLMTMFNGGPRF